MMKSHKIHTMKFGGTSVGSGKAITNVVGIVKDALEQGERVVVVVSAMSGVTDALIDSVRLAIEGDRWGYLSLSQKLRDKHEEAIQQLIASSAEREATLIAVGKLLDQHVELCAAIGILGEATPRIHDAVISFGERLSCRIVAAALHHAGVNAAGVDAGQLLITDNSYGSAQPFWDETQRRITAVLQPQIEAGIVPVITGFIGATPDGSYTTLGRGGSDYSAAIFAAYVNSDLFTIWTDVDGVMTTDPRIDKRARVLPYVSYTEIGELAYFGAKVVHPKTIQPILDRSIPIYVRNTFNPAHPGTLIGPENQPSTSIIKAVTAIQRVSMLTVSGRGMLGVPGIAGRTFQATAQSGANILMLSQSSSEQSFCFTVQDDKAVTVKDAVETELEYEIARQDIDRVDIANDIVILTVVGSGMRGTPGIAGRIFTTLGANNINVLAIAQGSSECSISFVLAEPDMKRAVVALHDLALETVPVA
jgi:aspartate kinase